MKACLSLLIRYLLGVQVSKLKNAEANRSDYHEWSVSERLNPHPNVLRIAGLCPAFEHPTRKEAKGSTALIAPWQENGGLRSFFDKRTHLFVLFLFRMYLVWGFANELVRRIRVVTQRGKFAKQPCGAGGILMVTRFVSALGV